MIDLEVPVEGVALDGLMRSFPPTGRRPIAQRSSSILGSV